MTPTRRVTQAVKLLKRRREANREINRLERELDRPHREMREVDQELASVSAGVLLRAREVLNRERRNSP